MPGIGLSEGDHGLVIAACARYAQRKKKSHELVLKSPV